MKEKSQGFDVNITGRGFINIQLPGYSQVSVGLDEGRLRAHLYENGFESEYVDDNWDLITCLVNLEVGHG